MATPPIVGGCWYVDVDTLSTLPRLTLLLIPLSPCVVRDRGCRSLSVLIAVVVGVNDGKMPVVGSTGVTPTFEDGGTSLVVGLDIMLGEDDSEVGIAEGGNADQGSGE
jgi:hypothetical protein